MKFVTMFSDGMHPCILVLEVFPSFYKVIHNHNLHYLLWWYASRVTNIK